MSVKTTSRKKPAQKHASAETETFPPLSVSLPDLLDGGSDLQFRRLLYSLLTFSSLIERHRAIYGAYIGVSAAQYVMIAIMSGKRDVTAAEIATQLDVSTQFVAMETGKLIDRGLVAKEPSRSDRRKMLLNLTPKGRQLLRELGPVRQTSNDLMYRSLVGGRAKILQAILDDLIHDAKIALHALEGPDLRDARAPSAVAAAPRRGPSPR